MRHLLFILLLLSAKGFADTSDWETYLAWPSSENAKSIKAAPIPEIIDEAYDVLSVQVLAGDLEAIKLAVRLSNWLDLSAATSEALSALIGKTVRPYPNLFLYAVISSEHAAQCAEVTSYGFEYIDNISGMLFENKQRQIALSTVNDGKLLKIKDACLNILKAHEVVLKQWHSN